MVFKSTLELPRPIVLLRAAASLVQPLAIDQHQHLVGAEGAQGKLWGMVSAIGNGGGGGG